MALMECIIYSSTPSFFCSPSGAYIPELGYFKLDDVDDGAAALSLSLSLCLSLSLSAQSQVHLGADGSLRPSHLDVCELAI